MEILKNEELKSINGGSEFSEAAVEVISGILGYVWGSMKKGIPKLTLAGTIIRLNKKE
jgi:hypothetical protein